jgi:hypothetical protein
MVPIYTGLIIRQQLTQGYTISVSYFNDAILRDKAWNGNESLLFRSICCNRGSILVVLVGGNNSFGGLLGVSGGSEISAL